MRWTRLVGMALAALLLAAPVGAAPPLTCQSCNRPDLPDYEPLTIYQSGLEINGLYGYSYGYAHLVESAPPRASGFQFFEGSNGPGEPVRAAIWWELFEPDKIQRGASKSTLSQSDLVAIGFYYYFNTGTPSSVTYTAVSMEGCKGSISRDEKKDESKWKIECGKDTLIEKLKIQGKD